jgi:2-polyprenyl-6-methoxyphenol hydroxylase-like FAD-dependent oxidoreductase
MLQNTGAERVDDVLIVGAGIAGSLLALVLGRMGRSVIVVDPRRDPPNVFRNEKLGTAQIALLKKLGVLSCFEAACWPAPGTPNAYPEDARPGLTDCGAPHREWLRGVRAAWPANVRFVEGTVESLALSDGVQTAVTADGEWLSARLAVVATGRMAHLLNGLGIEHRVISKGHSVCLGFSLQLAKPAPAQVIDAPAGSGVAYVSLFPMPGEMRVNTFSYRPLDDPWTRRMSADPIGCLSDLDPRLADLLEGATVVRRCEARGTDLYEATEFARPGLVLIGDAFHAPCPASGTGMLRILNDIDVLANAHLTPWLETPGMGWDKVEAFYADPAKTGLDAASLGKSIRGRRAVLSQSPYWRARRTLGALRRALAGWAEARSLDLEAARRSMSRWPSPFPATRSNATPAIWS